MARYHINPKTGMPSVCHARIGNCPYGGASGSDMHFETYSMALTQSQSMMEKEHSLLPLDDYGLSDEDWEKYEEIVNEEDGFSEDEINKKIFETKDVGLLIDIIEGRKYQERGWEKVSLALQNPNLPKEIIDDMLFINPNSYSKEARRHLILNNSIDRDTLNRILEEDDDEVMHALVYKHTRFDLRVIYEHLENDKALLAKMPHAFMLDNPALSEEDIDIWYDWVVANDVYIDTTEIHSVSMAYTDWTVTYNERD